MKKFIVYIMILVSCCLSCIDKFPLGDASYENLLVVDGFYHNGPGTYTVELSRSSSVSQPQYMPVKNALVKITDKTGASVVLGEIKPGFYQTNAEVMQGQSGQRYKLSIVLASGELYESPFVELKNAVGIDSVYARFERIPTTNPDFDLPGYQFYVSTAQVEFDSVYYLWMCNETYKYHAAYTMDFIYSGFLSPPMQSFDNKDSLYNCWKTASVSNFWVKSTIDLSSSQVTAFPLNFVSTRTNRLSVRYSLLVKQYSITAEAFDFWQAVKEQLTNDDILFNKQVYQVRGNVKNVNDPSEPVMGYFTVAGYKQKRIFIDRPQDEDVVEFSCPFVRPSFDILFSGPEDWPLFLALDPNGHPGFVEQYCFDCRIQGGKLEKPDFWKDE